MKTKILVIDDNKLTLKIICFVLEKNDFEIIIAEDGIEAIEKFDEVKPDLVIADILLPFKSGLEVAHHIKTKSPETPVVVLSALGEEESTVEKAFEFKVDDFISKPFSPNELLLRVKRLLR
ncbi:response regulator transcription factor [Psychroflexus sediminis]|uniref:Response regulator receiver domain-containing protein n=1 Tax=Psychroflexus sediminis TaxID=470826 RepID=A0A1G7XCP9_9FLAO|nr:response regulator [Psychroflexus sediminis]SDG81884.1 Response regulator receiver domain-containing protein [Psychroflexus sediminis]